MIESRYKIEYVLPDEDSKKSSSFKVIWYLLLIPIVLLLVTAITYDFSIQNIARDSSLLAEKAKVHVFNLSDNTQPNKSVTQTNQVIEKKPAPKAKIETVTKQIIAPAKPIVKNEKEQRIISELTAKQEEQLKAIQEQIIKNKKLSQNLNSLSTELVREKTKNDSLNSQLSEQEKDRLELEEQLNKILAESKNNEVVIKDFPEENTSKTAIVIEPNDNLISKTIEKVKTIKDKEIVEQTQTPIVKSTNVTEDTDNNNQETENAEVALSTDEIVKPIETETSTSATDKIIQAMNSIKSNNVSVSTEIETTTSELTIEKTKVPETKAEDNNKPETKSNDVIFAIGIESNSDDNAIEATNTSTTDDIQTEDKSNKIESESISVSPPPTEEITKVAEVEKPEIESKTAIISPKQNSSVDAIIAAMQESEDTNTQDDSSEKIDLELEKEIKQQLVEQGDLSIDN